LGYAGRIPTCDHRTPVVSELISFSDSDRRKTVPRIRLALVGVVAGVRYLYIRYHLLYWMRMSLERELLTSVGRLLLALGRAGGRATFTEARRAVGSQIYYALRQAGALGLIVEEGGGRVIKLSDKGREVAECLVRCFGSSSSGTR